MICSTRSSFFTLTRVSLHANRQTDSCRRRLASMQRPMIGARSWVKKPAKSQANIDILPLSPEAVAAAAQRHGLRCAYPESQSSPFLSHSSVVLHDLHGVIVRPETRVENGLIALAFASSQCYCCQQRQPASHSPAVVATFSVVLWRPFPSKVQRWSHGIWV